MSDELKILLVADKVNQIPIEQSLKKANLPVAINVIQQGSLGLEHLQQNTYHCLLIDLQLPDIDGISFIKLIRERGISTPILLIIPQNEVHLTTTVLRNGITDYVLKDFLSAEIITHNIKNIRRLYEVEQQRAATENALQLIQDSLKESQKLAKIGNWEYNRITDEMFWSEEIYRIFELDWSHNPSIQDFISRIHPDDIVVRERVIQEAIEKRKNYTVDYRLIFPGDKIKYTTAHGTPIYNQQNNLVGFIGTIQDISDRINTRIALKESKERYLMLIETMNEGVIHLNADEIVVYANKQFCEKMGYKKKEVIGQSFNIFIPDAATRALVDEKNALRQKLVSDQYEIKLKKKNGELICFLIGASPLTGPKGEIIGSLGALTDITERKKIEDALSSSEKLFRTLFENTPGFICTHALDGEILSINQSGANILGFKPENLIGQNFKTLLDKDVSARFENYLEAIKLQKQASGIIKVTDKLKKHHHYLLYRNTLYQEPGKEAYIIASAQDITERIVVERELTKAKIIAERSVKIKEQFLANISHEIRTPMNGILGLTAVLQKMIQDEEQLNYLQAIQSSADKLLVIINDVLDFSKIEAGKIDFEETEFNPTLLIKESIHLLEPKAAEKNNKLKAIIDTDVPEVIKGDPGKLSQIINNLLSNAIKFTQAGFIKIIVEVAEDNPDHVVLEFSVEDNGIGIPEDKLKSIFEGFTQASSNTTRKYGGTGLGLTISKRFIELQGGIITVKSKPNQGSVFKFRLSFNKVTAVAPLIIDAPEEPLLPIQPSDLGKLRVLLAEDNEINQLLVKKVMSEWGFQLDIAPNGIRALELFNQNEYDVILMDMQMPELDGYQTTSTIRNSLKPKSKTAIIALTAHASVGEAAKCIEAGADAYLSKPFKADLLLREIGILLNKVPESNLSESSPTPIQKTDMPENELNNPSINLTYLRDMASGDTGFMEEIMEMFILQTPENMDKLQEFTQNKQWLEVKSLAHKMKSSVILVGIKELEELFIDLQKEAVGPNPEVVIPPLFQRAKTLCAIAVAELKVELKAIQQV